MNWLDRYVWAVKRYLPKRMRDDIGEELQSLLEEKMDEGQHEKGGPLQEADTLALLKDFGHPLEVASRYRSQRVLIGESLFPIYKQVLKYLVFTLLTVYLVLTLVEASGIFEWWPENMNGSIEHIGLWYVIIVTALFYALETYLSRIDFFGRWNPKKLPLIHEDWANIPLASSITSLLFIVLWFMILCAINNEYSWAIFAGQSDGLAASFVIWLKAQALLQFLLTTANVFAPYWTRFKLLSNALLNVLFSLIVIKALMVGDWASTAIHELAEGAEPEEAAPFLDLVDLVMTINLWIILLVALSIAVFNVRRAIKVKA